MQIIDLFRLFSMYTLYMNIYIYEYKCIYDNDIFAPLNKDNNTIKKCRFAANHALHYTLKTDFYI